MKHTPPPTPSVPLSPPLAAAAIAAATLALAGSCGKKATDGGDIDRPVEPDPPAEPDPGAGPEIVVRWVLTATLDEATDTPHTDIALALTRDGQTRTEAVKHTASPCTAEPPGVAPTLRKEGARSATPERQGGSTLRQEGARSATPERQGGSTLRQEGARSATPERQGRNITPRGALLVASCFWAGAGSELRVYHERDTLRVEETITDEGLETPIVKDLQTLELPAGARVSAGEAIEKSAGEAVEK